MCEKLEDAVKQGDVNLTLMGITPTYPSDKYGYIIPEDNGEVSKVKSLRKSRIPKLQRSI